MATGADADTNAARSFLSWISGWKLGLFLVALSLGSAAALGYFAAQKDTSSRAQAIIEGLAGVWPQANPEIGFDTGLAVFLSFGMLTLIPIILFWLLNRTTWKAVRKVTVGTRTDVVFAQLALLKAELLLQLKEGLSEYEVPTERLDDILNESFRVAIEQGREDLQGLAMFWENLDRLDRPERGQTRRG